MRSDLRSFVFSWFLTIWLGAAPFVHFVVSFFAASNHELHEKRCVFLGVVRGFNSSRCARLAHVG
jgi:hypothetical protein